MLIGLLGYLSLDYSRGSTSGYAVLAHLSMSYSPPRGKFLRVTQPFATPSCSARENPKSQILNPKQITIFKITNHKQKRCLEHWNLVLGICLEIRN